MAIATIPQRAMSEQGFSFRNLIINGDMSIWQRATSASSISSDGYFTVDRFSHNTNPGGTWTISQDTDVPTGQGFPYSVKYACTTADASLAANDQTNIRTKIEANSLQHLKYGTANAEALTLSFWVKSNKTGTYVVWFYNEDGVKSFSAQYTISASSTWEKKTISVPANTVGTITNNNEEGLRIMWFLCAGSDWTSGTIPTNWETDTKANRAVGQVNLADSTSNVWYITGVQLEVGTSASDFEFLPYDVNLQRCERYYQFGVGGWYGLTSGGGYGGVINFRNKMRTSPSINSSGCSILDYNNRFNSTAVTTATYISDDGAIIQKAQSVSSDSGYYMAKLAFDAEL